MTLHPLIEAGWVNAILPELILCIGGMLMMLFAAFLPRAREISAPLALIGFIVAAWSENLVRAGRFFGGTYEVIHHTQLLARLIKDGRLKPNKAVDGKFTYHDSCYLGRWNDIYDPPREVIEAIPGAKLVEIERHRMWMEEKIGKRINHERVEQTLRTEAPRVATACPFCLTMFRDGIAAKGAEARLQVKDLAQYLAESIDEAPVSTTISG